MVKDSETKYPHLTDVRKQVYDIIGQPDKTKVGVIDWKRLDQDKDLKLTKDIFEDKMVPLTLNGLKEGMKHLS